MIGRGMVGVVGAVGLAAVAGVAAARRPAVQGAPVLRTVAELPLPGPAVRFDYQSLDTTTNRLYIAHMNAERLVVVDVSARRVVANLAGFDRVHGVIAVPTAGGPAGRVYAAVTGRHQVAVVDAQSLTVLARVGGMTYPDGLAYAPDARRVFVSDEHGAADVVVDAATNRVVATIPLGGGAGNTVFDPGSGRVLVAVHGRNDLAVVDPAAAAIIRRIPLPGLEDPHGIALDVAHHVAFVAAEGNARLAVVDLATGRVTGTYAVARAPDVLAFDPGWRRLYVAAESGSVTVFQATPEPTFGTASAGTASAGTVSLVRLGELATPHAHTVAVDPRTHLVYLPLEDVAGTPRLRVLVGPAPRGR